MAERHNYGSFDYKVINKNVRDVLDNRAKLNNTIQMAAPFVKATATIQHKLLGRGNVGFTLGTQTVDTDLRYEDIFSSRDGTLPLIGYTYGVRGETIPVYANDVYSELGTNLSETLNPRFELQSIDQNFVRFSPPGITNVTIGKNRNGLVSSATMQIKVATLLQLEALHRVFLVPGLGIVLEWGQQFTPSVADVTEFGEAGISTDDTRINMFPWQDVAKRDELFERLSANQVGINEIFDKYVEPSQGQYMWMFGRVANFDITSNNDGSFDISLKIVGPAEDSWAYNTVNTVVPPRDASTEFFCAGKVTSVVDYFSKTTTGPNFKTFLDNTLNPANNSPWQKHVIRIKKGNAVAGKPTKTDESPNVDQTLFGETEDAYFISWRFFVNEVLNGKQGSLKEAVFGSTLEDTKYGLGKVGLLVPYAHGDARQFSGPELGDYTKFGYIDDPYESFVGMNEYLRSVDPSVLVIVNESAAKLAEQSEQYKMLTSDQDMAVYKELVHQFKRVGLFDKSTSALSTPYTDRGFLSSGVWINHKAVVECMLGANTILGGISNLLNRMSAATLNYWNLTIDVLEPDSVYDSSYNYMVVDSNFKSSSDDAVSKFLKEVHVFNKSIRKNTSTNELYGSDVIEAKVDLSLPKRLFSQIATLGLVQPEDLQKAGVSTIDNNSAEPGKISDPNDALREMFAITSIGEMDIDGNIPDLTYPKKSNTSSLISLQQKCGHSNTRTPAGTTGTGEKATSTQVYDQYKDASVETLEKIIKESNEQLAKQECIDCKNERAKKLSTVPQVTPSPAQPVNPTVPTQPINSSNKNELCSKVSSGKEQRLCLAAYDAGITNPTEMAQFLAQINHESIGLTATVENLNYNAAALRRVFPRYFTEEQALDYQRQPERIANRAYANRNGNGSESSGDGWKFRGRGYIQLTGKSNYIAFSKVTGIDVVKNPEYLQTEEGAIKSAIFFWTNNVRPQMRRGRSNGTVPKNASFADTQAVTYIVNGGQNGIADRKSLFQRYINALAGALVPEVLNPEPEKKERVTAACVRCNMAQRQLEQASAVLPAKQEFQAVLRKFEGLKDIFRYVEIYPSFMTAQITKSADGVKANAFGASPGTLSISADLVLPGINGLRIGQLFWIDRIPSFYKAFGAFQIISIEDNISSSGWTTKIHARFNYLGKQWKTAMLNQFKKTNNT